MKLPIGTLLIVLLIIIACSAILLTKKGRSVILFAREARTEIRKVIWPTRQETLRTTLIVAVVTIIMTIILWGLDNFLVRLISFITRLRL